MEAGGHLADVHTNGAGEVIYPHRAHAEFAAAAFGYVGDAAEAHGIVWSPRADGERVFMILALCAAHIGNACEKFAIARRGEGELRVLAQAALAIVVVFKINGKGR